MPPLFNRSARALGTVDTADSVTRHIDQQIGKELRALYNAVLDEPVPDRFLALLDQLDTAASEAHEPPAAQTPKAAEDKL